MAEDQLGCELKVEIKAGQDFIAVHETIRQDATEKAFRLTNASAMKTTLVCVLQILQPRIL